MRRTLRRVPAGIGTPKNELRSTAVAFPIRKPARKAALLSRIVVDASVVSKWFMQEPLSEAARRLVSGKYQVCVPDLVFSELGSILQRRVAQDEITDSEALSVLQVLAKMPLQVYRTWSLGPIALELQRALKSGVYDCIHMALALQEGAVLVTANRPLYEALHATALARHVCWIEDVPAL